MQRQKGQTMVEFAVVFPFFMFLFLSVLYIGIMFLDYTQYSNAARDAARDISLQAGTKSDATDLRNLLAKRINDKDDQDIHNRYSVALTNLYTPAWNVEFINAKGETSKNATQDSTDVQVTINLTREPLPSALENLNILPVELKPISFKMALEQTTIIYKQE